MRDWMSAHRGVVGGVLLAAGIPTVILVGGSLVFEVALLPPLYSARFDQSAWFLIALVLLPVAMLWPLVRGILRFGGVAAVGIGLGIDAAGAVLLTLVSRSQSDGFLGGFVAALWALAIALCIVVAVLAAVLPAGIRAIRTRGSGDSGPRRQA